MPRSQGRKRAVKKEFGSLRIAADLVEMFNTMSNVRRPDGTKLTVADVFERYREMVTRDHVEHLKAKLAEAEAKS